MTVYAIDCSLTIREDQYWRIISMIKEIAQPSDIILGFDTRVFGVTPVSEIDSFYPSGGCGIRYQSVIDWAKENNHTKVIIFSDGYGCDDALNLGDVEAAIVLVGKPINKTTKLLIVAGRIE